MYRCTDCQKIFEECERAAERHGLCSPPYEKITVCPFCYSTAIEKIEAHHCRCCGVRLSGKTREYCSESCRIRGMKLWRLEAARKRKILSNPISIILSELVSYNELHKTAYSYGQYVSLIRPRLMGKDGKLCLN